MPLIDSLIRKKRLLLARAAVELQRRKREYEHTVRDASAAKSAHESAQHYLWQHLAGTETVCIQRLTTARLKEAATQMSLRDLVALHESQESFVREIEIVVNRLQREIEKLAELSEENIRDSRMDAIRNEWRGLDEWVVNRHGGLQ